MVADNNNEENNKEDAKVNHLSDFISKNNKVISVLGVFTALTVFTNNLVVKEIGQLLSFTFLVITIVIWMELWTKFPPKPISWRLRIFQYGITFSMIMIIFYLLVAYRIIWKSFLVFPIWFVLLALLGYLNNRYELIDKIQKSKIGKFKPIVLIIFSAIFIGLLLGTGFIAGQLAKYLNIGLDILNDEIINGKGLF